MLKDFLLLLGLLILSGLFSGLETAFVAVNSIKARSFRDQNIKNGLLLYNLKQNQRKLIITVLIGNNFVNIGASSYASYIFTLAFGSAGVGIATGVMTLLILTFGEILPKTYFAKHSDTIALRFAKFIYFLEILFYPITFIFEKISDIFKINEEVSSAISEKDIQAMINVGAEREVLHKKQKEMLDSVFEFDDTKVKEIMTPRIDIFALEENESVRGILRKVKISGFSRIPIYRKKIDKIVGFIHIRDIAFAMNKDLTVKDLKSEILFVSEQMIIQELFTLFQKSHKHIAVVIDEFGGTSGIVTLEDVLEEIVGEIMDETDEDEVDIKKVNHNTYVVNGDTSIYDVNEHLKIKLPEKRAFSSVGGYIHFKIKDIPVQGQEIIDKRKNLKFIIEKMNDQKIQKIKIIKKL